MGGCWALVFVVSFFSEWEGWGQSAFMSATDQSADMIKSQDWKNCMGLTMSVASAPRSRDKIERSRHLKAFLRRLRQFDEIPPNTTYRWDGQMATFIVVTRASTV